MDVEKTIEFILNAQAKREVTLQAILETQAKHDRRFANLVDVCMSLPHHGEETDRRMRELDEGMNRRFREISDRFQETGLQIERAD